MAPDCVCHGAATAPAADTTSCSNATQVSRKSLELGSQPTILFGWPLRRSFGRCACSPSQHIAVLPCRASGNLDHRESYSIAFSEACQHVMHWVFMCCLSMHYSNSVLGVHRTSRMPLPVKS